MTLILTIPASNGVVMASDGQITAGMVRSAGQKIQRLNERCLWAASGELALIQRVGERIGSLPLDQPLEDLRDSIGRIVTQCVSELLQLDFRTQFFRENPDTLLKLHPGDFVFAEWRNGPRILHITANGTPEWVVDRPFATGSGEPFAYALLQKYHGRRIDIVKASILAYKVIEEAIQVGAYGLGTPIDLWHITEDRVEQLNETKLAGIEDAVKALRETEISLLVGGEG